MNQESDRLFRQSAAIPYLRNEDGFQVVLVTNGKRTAWIYPKGVVERNMTAPDSAANEAYEEAGVVGAVSDILLDEYTYEKWGGLCTVKVYPLEVQELLEDWDEKGMRKRRVVDLDSALEMIKKEQREGLLNLIEYLS